MFIKNESSMGSIFFPKIGEENNKGHNHDLEENTQHEYQKK